MVLDLARSPWWRSAPRHRSSGSTHSRRVASNRVRNLGTQHLDGAKDGRVCRLSRSGVKAPRAYGSSDIGAGRHGPERRASSLASLGEPRSSTVTVRSCPQTPDARKRGPIRQRTRRWLTLGRIRFLDSLGCPSRQVRVNVGGVAGVVQTSALVSVRIGGIRPHGCESNAAGEKRVLGCIDHGTG